MIGDWKTGQSQAVLGIHPAKISSIRAIFRSRIDERVEMLLEFSLVTLAKVWQSIQWWQPQKVWLQILKLNFDKSW